MAVNGGKRKQRFGKPGGFHAKRRNLIYQHKYRYSTNNQSKKPQNKGRLVIIRRSILKKYNIRQKRAEGINRLLFVKTPVQYNIRRISSEKPFNFKISRVSGDAYDGYRLMNLELLQKHIGEITLHAATCSKLHNITSLQRAPIKLKTEVRTLGLASVLESQCLGCKHVFRFDTSPQISNGHTNHFDVNVRAVWGSMVTGGGVAHLNETMATLNAPGVSQQTYSNIEQEICDLWNVTVQDDLLAAGAEERRIAIEKGHFHEGIPYITVICDGGWSKRSHKHTYNALGGVAVIIGAETGKLLHIGVRNKHCYICSQAESNHTEPKHHRCFQNWTQSSQAMESDILVEGFQQAERVHGVRYMKMIGDGDSSVYSKILENVPVWGKSVQKLECANHVCKCLRSSLEKLVDTNPMYKGKNRLTKALRVRLTSAVRCAIRMRSNEPDKTTAVKKLDHDIRNSIYHITGSHERCSDFCKAKQSTSLSQSSQSNNISTPITTEEEVSESNSIPGILEELSSVWSESLSLDAQEESRGDNFICTDIDSLMMKDIQILLDRVASKSHRLLGNTTTNLAESWMSIRQKFDGGKLYNRCNRGSWHSRCLGGCLRKNLGTLWSPLTWKKTTSSEPGYFFWKLYGRRDCTLNACKKSKLKPEVKARRLKRKYQGQKQANTKQARLEYGPEAADCVPDITKEELESTKFSFLEKHINLSDEKIEAIENMTKQQSSSPVWLEERKKRITASNFSAVVKRNPALPVKKLVQSLLYSTFKGNAYTRRGLQEEAMTIKEYVSKKAEVHEHVKVQSCGLTVCKEHKYLAASPDGKVLNENMDVIGLLEIKNLLQNKPINLNEAVKQVKTFCLENKTTTDELHLKKTHPYYYQVQGLLNITNLPWADFVVRTTNPYQLHIERIFTDKDFWKSTMLPKLHSFYYKAILPELACPRYHTITGIREPGNWHDVKKNVGTSSACNSKSDNRHKSTSSKRLSTQHRTKSEEDHSTTVQQQSSVNTDACSHTTDRRELDALCSKSLRIQLRRVQTTHKDTIDRHEYGESSSNRLRTQHSTTTKGDSSKTSSVNRDTPTIDRQYGESSSNRLRTRHSTTTKGDSSKTSSVNGDTPTIDRQYGESSSNRLRTRHSTTTKGDSSKTSSVNGDTPTIDRQYGESSSNRLRTPHSTTTKGDSSKTSVNSDTPTIDRQYGESSSNRLRLRRTPRVKKKVFWHDDFL